MGVLKTIFGKRSTTKADVILALAGAFIAVVKAIDTSKQYKLEQEEKKS